jgi:hypothetical protein
MRMVAGKYLGKNQMFIQTDNDDSRLNDIFGNTQYFKFHSGYPKLELLATASGTLNLPAHNKAVYSYSSKKGSGSYDIPTRHDYLEHVLYHTVDADTFCLAYDQSSNLPLNGALPVQQAGTSFRVVTVDFTGGAVRISSETTTMNTNLPAMAINYVLYLVRVVYGNTNPSSGVLLDATPERVVFGDGVLDTDNPYFQEVTSGDHFLLFGKVPYSATRYVKYNTNNAQKFRRIKMAYNLAGIKYQLDGGSYPADQVTYKVWS